MITGSDETDQDDLSPLQPLHVLAAEVLERIASANPRDHAIWQTAYAAGLAAGQRPATRRDRMTETTTELPTVSLDDLDALVAAVTAWMPSDASVDVQDAFDRLETAWRRATVEHARIEYWGVRVTEITKHGQAAYRIEKPEHVFGGDPYAVSYHAAQSWFSEERVTEQSARAAWDKRLQDAEDRRKREEAWEAEQAKRREQRALTSGQDGGEDGPGCGCAEPGYICEECRSEGVF